LPYLQSFVIVVNIVKYNVPLLLFCSLTTQNNPRLAVLRWNSSHMKNRACLVRPTKYTVRSFMRPPDEHRLLCVVNGLGSA
jgi:hypothetical protein